MNRKISMLIYPKAFDQKLEVTLTTEAAASLSGYHHGLYRISYNQGSVLVFQPVCGGWQCVGHWPAAAVLAKTTPYSLSIDFGLKWEVEITQEVVSRLQEIMGGVQDEAE